MRVAYKFHPRGAPGRDRALLITGNSSNPATQSELHALLADHLEGIMEAFRECDPDHLEFEVHALHLAVSRWTFRDISPSVFSPITVIEHLFEPVRESPDMGLIAAIIDLTCDLILNFQLPHSWELLTDEIVNRFQYLISLGHEIVAVPIIRLMNVLYDPRNAGSHRVFDVLPSGELPGIWEVSLKSHRELLSYFNIICEFEQNWESIVELIQFCERILQGRLPPDARSPLWCLAIVSKNHPDRRQEMVDNLTELPGILETQMSSNDDGTRRAVLILFLYFAESQCRMPGYRVHIVVEALHDPAQDVRSLAVLTLASLIRVRQLQDENDRICDQDLFDIIVQLIHMVFCDSFNVQRYIFRVLPRMCVEDLHPVRYRQLVSRDGDERGIFDALAKMGDADGIEVDASVPAFMDLIDAVQQTAEREGWTNEFYEAISAPEMIDLLHLIAAAAAADLQARVDQILQLFAAPADDQNSTPDMAASGEHGPE
jgi:hypothetical protein